MKNNSVKILVLILILSSASLAGCTKEGPAATTTTIGEQTTLQPATTLASQTTTTLHLPSSKLLQWTKEGQRLDDGVSPATLVISGMYVMYYTAGSGILVAKSTEGLNFEKAGVAVGSGESGSGQEMVSNPAIIELSNGYRMIYEGSRFSSGGQTDRKLYSAFSVDGFNWTKESGVRFWDYGDGKSGEFFTSVPDIIRLGDGRLRMYYTRGISSATAISSDDGLAWVKEGNLDLGGIAVDPDIVQLEDGTYKLFYTAFDSQFGVGEQYVMSASSVDGVNFVVDSGKRLRPAEGSTQIVDPDIVKLPDGRYRMYYGETGTDMLFSIYSAISG